MSSPLSWNSTRQPLVWIQATRERLHFPVTLKPCLAILRHSLEQALLHLDEARQGTYARPVDQDGREVCKLTIRRL